MKMNLSQMGVAPRNPFASAPVINTNTYLPIKHVANTNT